MPRSRPDFEDDVCTVSTHTVPNGRFLGPNRPNRVLGKDTPRTEPAGYNIRRAVAILFTAPRNDLPHAPRLHALPVPQRRPQRPVLHVSARLRARSMCCRRAAARAGLRAPGGHHWPADASSGRCARGRWRGAASSGSRGPGRRRNASAGRARRSRRQARMRRRAPHAGHCSVASPVPRGQRGRGAEADGAQEHSARAESIRQGMSGVGHAWLSWRACRL